MKFTYKNLAPQIKEKFTEDECVKIRNTDKPFAEIAKTFNTSVNVIEWIKANPQEDLQRKLHLKANNFVKKLDNYSSLSDKQLQKLINKIDDMSDFLNKTEAIADVAWSEFMRQLEHKASWRGKTIVKIDKWFPSSQGTNTGKKALNIREFDCPHCKNKNIDHDINAAVNIINYGLGQIDNRSTVGTIGI